MKKLLLAIFFYVGFLNTAFALVDGDIAFVSFNSDVTKSFSFVALVNLPAGTQITFTDNGWLAAGSFRTGEGFITWTSPSGGVGCGSVVTLAGDSGNFNLSTSGDQIFAFQGASSSPTFLAGINFDGTDWASDATSSNNSALPSGLTTEIAISEIDNAIYTGMTTVGDKSQLLLSLLLATNWTGSDTNTANYSGSFSVTGCVPLPVELIEFYAKLQNDNIVLTWQTASEENNSHFEIEHSTNARDFQMLDKVTGNGTTSEIQQYHYMHKEAAIGKNYYRLRQVDFDGAFEYSDVAVAEIKGEGQVQIRPTLVNEQVALYFGESTRDDVALQIFDIAGRQVSSQVIVAGTEQMELSVADLVEGLYFVQLPLNGEMTTLKFVKR